MYILNNQCLLVHCAKCQCSLGKAELLLFTFIEECTAHKFSLAFQ